MEDVDDDMWKSYQVLDTYFTVPRKYELQTVVGRGQYGTVCRATTVGKDGVERKVALKKIAVPCTGRVELPELRRVVREVALLKHFHHENIIGLEDAFIAPTLTTEKNTEDVYLVMELLDVDLAGLLKLHRALSLDHVRYFGSQMLRAMAHVHESGIMHRDLKPSNIVVNGDCDLKIVDFGLARVLDGDEMTEYVVTRYYRAPELLLESSNYTPAIDMWSVGCILVEMAAGSVLIPGNDIRDQVVSILKTTGKPPPRSIEKISSERAREFVRSQPDFPSMDLMAFIKREREKRGREMEDFAPLCDLVSKLLVFSAEERLSAREALLHPLWTDEDEEEEAEEEEPEEGPAGEEGVEGGGGQAGDPPAPLLHINVERKTVPELRSVLEEMVGAFPSERLKREKLRLKREMEGLPAEEPAPTPPAPEVPESPADAADTPNSDDRTADRESDTARDADILEYEKYYPI